MGSTNRQVVMMAIALIAMACTAGSGGAAGSGTRKDPDFIDGEELGSVHAITAYDAIQRLRPRWLQANRRRTPPRVVVSRTHRTNVYELRRIRAEDVESLRFLSPPDATTRYGTGFLGGAIEVTLRRR